MKPLVIRTSDDFSLSATLFEGKSDPDLDDEEVDPNVVIVIQSATGVPQYYYYAFAEYLIKQANATYSQAKYDQNDGDDLEAEGKVKGSVPPKRPGIKAILTYDYRGIGKSVPRTITAKTSGAKADNSTPDLDFLKANPNISILDHWATRDQIAVWNWVRENYPSNQNRVLIGHSVGGQISPYVGDLVSRMLWISVNSPYWGTAPDPVFRFSSAYVLGPLISKLVFGYFPSDRLGLGLPIPLQCGLDWMNSCKYPAAYADFHPPARTKYANLGCRKLLAISFEDDELALQGAFTSMLNRLCINNNSCQIRYTPFKNPPRGDFIPVSTSEPLSVIKSENLNFSVGHLGFFRKNVGATSGLWASLLPFILEGEWGTPYHEERFKYERLAKL